MTAALPLLPRLALVPLAALVMLLGLASTAPVRAQGAAPAATTRPAAPPAAAKPAPRTPARPEAAPAPLPPAGAEQMSAFEATLIGEYACEFNEAVKVVHHARHAGYIDVQHRKAVYTMKPVISSTGAVRLEDVRGRMLMLQIANKSMLMDTRLGQRLVDNCMHEKQREFAAQPPAQSLGIAPPAAGASAPR